MGGEERKEAAEAWPELVAFTAAMRARLEEKAPEWGKSWKEASPEHLFEVLAGHYGSLWAGIGRGDAAEIQKKAINVANLAMMIYDVAASEQLRPVDPMEEFIKENCIPDPGREVLASIVYKRFVVWYHSNVGRGEPSRTWFNKQFSKKFAGKPYDKSLAHGVAVFLGVSLVRACRVCGCTEENACTGGCSWVKDPQGGDLCSRCAPGGK